MADSRDSVYISSKEILDRAGISRATLNNYIKLGILPKPVVKKPEKEHKNIKSLGYFPEYVLDTLEEVKRLKKIGRSMGSIAMELGDPSGTRGKRTRDVPAGIVAVQPKEEIKRDKLTFSLEGLSDAGYLLNFDFEIVWFNRSADEEIFHLKNAPMDPTESRNIFNLLFRPEFQNQIQNWKDLIAFHMSFAKIKYARTWLKRLYEGISHREVHILETIYDNAQIFHDKPIQDARIDLKKRDGSIERYRVFSIFFDEGILFIHKRR